MDETTRQILEEMAAGRIPTAIPDTAEYAETLRRLAQYLATIQHFTLALSNGDLNQSLQGVTGPVAGGLKSLQSGLLHLTWQAKQITTGDFSQRVDFMGDFSTAFNTMVEDLAERKVVEEAVGRERNFSDDIINSLPGIFYMFDAKGELVRWNKKYEEVTGYSPAELQGKHVLDFFSEEHQNLIASRVQSVFAEGESFAETPFLIKNGHQIPYYFTGRIATLDGQEYLLGVGTDITERKRAEEELRKSEGHLRTLVQTIPDLIWLKDKDGVYLSCNPMFERFFGARETEIIGKTDYNFVDRELAEFFVAHDRKAMAAGKPTSNEEWVTFADDGHRALLETIKTPMYDDGGVLIGVLGIGRDITDRKQGEEELEFKNALLSTQQETTLDGILVVDENNTIISYNRKFTDIWGIPRTLMEAGNDVPVLRFVTRLVADKEGFLAAVRYLYEHKEEQSREEIFLKDGRVIDRYSAPMLGADGNYLGRVWYFRDITERKHLEEAQRESQQLLTDIFDFLPDATLVLDNDKKVIAWNRAIEEMTGISKTEMLGQGDYASSVPFYGVRAPHLLDLLDVDDKELEARYSYVKRNGNRLQAEVPTPALYGGKGAWLWAFGAPLYNAKGERIGGIESVRDITAQKEAQLALKESRQRLMDIIEFLPDATFIIDRKGSIMAWNRAIEVLTGIKAQEMIGKGDYEYSIPFYGDRRLILIDFALCPDPEREKFYTSFQRDGDTLVGEAYVPSLRSSKAYLSTTASVLRDSRGEIVAAIECIRDHTKRQEMEEALRATQNQLALAMELSRLVKWEFDIATGMFTFDDQFYALYGTSVEREGGYLMSAEVYVREFVHPDDGPLVTEVLGNTLAFTERTNSGELEHRIVCRNGEIRDIVVKFRVIRDHNGTIIKTYGANQDITKHKRLEKMLHQQARTDQMTGVNNRGYFLELLDVEIERARRYGRSLCVLMLDLDHFKLVNDTRGHAAGDEAIRTVTRVIQSAGLRQSDFLGRIGGEEFAVALPETHLHEAADAAERVRSQLAVTPVSYASTNFFITVSIGVCDYRDGDSQETLLQRADQAMYQAKQTGRNRVCWVS